jgi:hypothetical protein
MRLFCIDIFSSLRFWHWLAAVHLCLRLLTSKLFSSPNFIRRHSFCGLIIILNPWMSPKSILKGDMMLSSWSSHHLFGVTFSALNAFLNLNFFGRILSLVAIQLTSRLSPYCTSSDPSGSACIMLVIYFNTIDTNLSNDEHALHLLPLQ